MIRKMGLLMGISALMITMLACNDDDDVIVHDMEPGTSEFTVTGDINLAFEGVAIFAGYIHQETGENFFTIAFGNQGEEIINIWFLRSGDAPPNGTYSVQSFSMDDVAGNDWFFDLEEFVAFSTRQVGQHVEFFFSENGTITLEDTGDNTFAGEFNFTATGSSINSQQTGNGEGEGEDETPDILEVQFSGKFNAVMNQVPLPPL
jgi:hypothetical protein